MTVEQPPEDGVTICDCEDCSCWQPAEDGEPCSACRAGYHTEDA